MCVFALFSMALHLYGDRFCPLVLLFVGSIFPGRKLSSGDFNYFFASLHLTSSEVQKRCRKKARKTFVGVRNCVANGFFFWYKWNRNTATANLTGSALVSAGAPHIGLRQTLPGQQHTQRGTHGTPNSSGQHNVFCQHICRICIPGEGTRCDTNV